MLHLRTSGTLESANRQIGHAWHRAASCGRERVVCGRWTASSTFARSVRICAAEVDTRLRPFFILPLLPSPTSSFSPFFLLPLPPSPPSFFSCFAFPPLPTLGLDVRVVLLRPTDRPTDSVCGSATDRQSGGSDGPEDGGHAEAFDGLCEAVESLNSTYQRLQHRLGGKLQAAGRGSNGRGSNGETHSRSAALLSVAAYGQRQFITSATQSASPCATQRPCVSACENLFTSPRPPAPEED
eukprot:GHVU01074837.1.p2 GENE.GHVU01074837.1~~GHVU01074837.1.p2  ORF type:complete len:240 (+),score=24.60 GHVU01074837.1:1242-1961(+)